MRWSFLGLVVALVAATFIVVLAPITAALPVSARSADDPADRVIATFETADGSTFRALLERPEDIARAEAALETDGQAGIPSGELAEGDGGINAPHDWRLVNVELADVTIELCDGTATMVDEDLDYWLNTVGQFCPWSATLIALEPAVDALPDTGAGQTGRFAAAHVPFGVIAFCALLTGLLAMLTASTKGHDERRALW